MESKAITISALNKYIKHIISNDSHLKNVVVVGEISNYTPHHSKHMYFTLKDDDSRIDSVMFSSNASKIDFPVKNGDKVIVRGYIDVYPPTGKYQLYVMSLSLDGIGDLTKRFELLKNKLASEGLFETSSKKMLPKFPKKIGVITATSGAAIRDIISTIERRYKMCEVVIFRTVVQGEYGKDSILNSLNLASDCDLDVVIIGRGGGSIEDLWNFNEEEVVRKIYEFDIPIISGVGHETDFTLCDFVCDVRAETPTAAAVLATPNTPDLIVKFNNVDDLLKNKLRNIISNASINVHKYNEKFFSDRLLYVMNTNQTTYLNECRRMDDAIENMLKDYRNQLNLVLSKNITKLLREHLYKQENIFKEYTSKLNTNVERIYAKNINYFEKYLTTLEQVNPLKILSRGYSISYSNNKIVKSVDDVGDNLQLVLSDGSVDIKINSKEVNKK